MIPIPRRLMTSMMTVSVPKDGGLYGGEYEDEKTIERVCFQGDSTVQKTDYQLQAPLRGVVFIDPTVSKGAFEIPAGSLVRVDDMETPACVKSCTPIPDAKHVHHWEVELV